MPSHRNFQYSINYLGVLREINLYYKILSRLKAQELIVGMGILGSRILTHSSPSLSLVFASASLR